MTHDCRTEIFRQRGDEVLSSVVQGTQLAQEDPFDFEKLHGDARQAFNTTLDLVRQSGTSRILLIRGEAGCGKTHLIRVLRWQTHTQRRGVVAYVHMTSEQVDYRQYLLRQVVKSLGDPYVRQAGETHQRSALEVVSDALVEHGLPAGAADQLREADDATLAALVTDFADQLAERQDADGNAIFGEVDLNTLRIFLYRQSTRKPIQRRVASFLNGEALAEMDWQKLSAMPRDCDRSPMHLLGQLARITHAATGMPLIICVDQIEASDLTGKDHAPFVRAMSTACELFEQERHLMLLLSCLDSVYQAHAPNLVMGYRHRIENDPLPVLLTAQRRSDEIREIVSRRFKWLFESEGLEHIPPDSVFPLPESMPDQLDRQSLRKVLQQIHGYWDECRRLSNGQMPTWKPATDAAPPPGPSPDDVDRLRNVWNDFHTAGGFDVGEDDDVQFELLAWALAEAKAELPEKTVVTLTPTGKTKTGVPCATIVVDSPRTPRVHQLFGLCDKDPRGGGLENQINSLETMWARGDQTLVVLRSTAFPRRGKTFDHLAKMAKQGHQHVTIEDGGWKSMNAMRQFLAGKARDFAPEVVAEWRRTDQPLLGIAGMSALLLPVKTGAATTAAPPLAASPTKPSASRSASKVVAPVVPVQPSSLFETPAPASDDTVVVRAIDDAVDSIDAVAVANASEPPTQRAPAEGERPGTEGPGVVADAHVDSVRDDHRTGVKPDLAAPLSIGVSDGFSPTPVMLDAQTLSRHTAILGANGSGKTVLAVTILEGLLERGVNVVLFDRKGDLASYAVAERWSESTGAPDEATRRPALRSAVDIDLFTPGSPAGRPLVLPMLPRGLDKLPADDRQELAREAAMVLTGVCAPAGAKADTFTAVLAKSIELLCGQDAPRSLDELQSMLIEPPQELLAMLPAHEPKHCIAVGQRLNERRVVHGRLFSDQGERIDLKQMIGGTPGRARLTIISTQFLDGDAGLIWIAQFLAEAGRYILRHPSPGGRLQAVMMFDEADQYIPATSKPPTKPGMENLLRRARAAGVGIMLASQNVGDFDYKALDNITTLFAGKLTTQRAIEKLQPRLGDRAGRLAKKGPGQFVMAVEGDVREIKGNMSLIRPTQVSRDQIERLARETSGRVASTAGA